MAGYTPVFDSVFQGSLCGKYPDLAVWLVLLALQQRGGIVDAHPSYIAMVSGLPQADIETAIARFCEPDPSSRTPGEDGRRLAPIEGQGFGWRIINHRKYQEKARLAARTAEEVASGKNAEKMRDRRRPPQTPADPPSDSDSDSDNKKKKNIYVPQVFEHWKSAWKHPRAQLDEKRRKVIARALRLYSAEQLCLAISGYLNSPFHRGKNQQQTVYDDIALFLKDAAHIDAGLRFSEQKPSDKLDPTEWQ